MNSHEICEYLENLIKSKNFNAPYGVLTGEHLSKKGSKYLYITFGRARTLDATIEIYNRKFMRLRTSRGHKDVYTDVKELEEALNNL